MKRFNDLVVFVLFVAGLMAGTGCMSTRILTDLKPEQNPELIAPAGTFYIAELNDLDPYKYTEERLHKMLLVLRRESVRDYPRLFTENPAGSVPLSVGMSCKTHYNQFTDMLWFYGTLMSTLPCPIQKEYDYKISVKVCAAGKGLLAPELEKTFRNEKHEWMSLVNPLAMIPVPGKSDFPKISGTVFSSSQMEKLKNERFARQVATATAQLVTTADPEFWTQPLISAPAGSLVLPTETVAPF